MLVGATNGHLFPGPFTRPHVGGFDALVVEISRPGNGIGYLTHGFLGADTAVAVASAPDGVPCWLARYGPDPDSGTYGWWREGGIGCLVRGGSTWFIIWHAFGTSTGDRLHGLTVTEAGDFVMVGGTTAAIAGTDPPFGGLDGFVMVFARGSGVAPALTMRWVRRIGTPGDDVAQGVALDTEGRVLVSGRTRGDRLGPAAQNAGGEDVFLLAFDDDGFELGRWQFGSAEDDVAYAAAAAPDGDLYVVGATDAPGSSVRSTGAQRVPGTHAALTTPCARAAVHGSWWYVPHLALDPYGRGRLLLLERTTGASMVA